MNMIIRIVAVVMSTAVLGGCTRPSLWPNPDKALRKGPSQLAADAAERHPYKSDLPSGGEANARAQVGYALDRLEVVNLSKENWKNVELWVNEKYVVFLPNMESRNLKVINFTMLYDDNGRYFPTNNLKTQITRLEAVRDGKRYEIPVRLGDLN